jgi:Na+-driven multidrug efflux pump
VGIWWALSAELVVRGLLFLLRFLFGRWDRITV